MWPLFFSRVRIWPLKPRFGANSGRIGTLGEFSGRFGTLAENCGRIGTLAERTRVGRRARWSQRLATSPWQGSPTPDSPRSASGQHKCQRHMHPVSVRRNQVHLPRHLRHRAVERRVFPDALLPTGPSTRCRCPCRPRTRRAAAIRASSSPGCPRSPTRAHSAPRPMSRQSRPRAGCRGT